MRFLDSLFGRTRLPKANEDRLFAITTAAVGLEASAGLTFAGRAGVIFRRLPPGRFDQLIADLRQLLALQGEGEGEDSKVEEQADQFAGGNYSDPSTIHGAAMPGLRELQAGADRVQVHYEEVPSGARITYSSSDRVMVAALHAWFDAQNSDHAMPGMGMAH